MSSDIDRYCGSSFWDQNLTWHTNDPDFTECFENTALLWTACGFLWITAIFDISFRTSPWIASLTGSAGADVPSWEPGWTCMGVLKIFIITILIFLEISVLIIHEFQLDDSPDSDIFSIPDVFWTTPFVLITTHLLSASLIIFHKSRCVHTSGIQLLHWLFLLLVHCLIFRTMFTKYYLDEPDTNLGVLILLGISTVLMGIQTFIFCWSDIPEPRFGGHHPLLECSDGINREECPMSRASCLNRVLFSWCTPLVRKGYKRPLTQEDLWELLNSLKAPVVFKLFNESYGKPDYGQKRSIYRNILRPLWKTCGWSLTLGLICRSVSVVLTFLAPTVMGSLIDFVEDPTVEEWKGYMWAVVLFLLNIISSFFLEQFYLHLFTCCANIMSCLNLKIYQKALNISNEARKGTTTGEIVNLMGVDVEKIRYLIYDADTVWSAPIQVSLGVFLLWNQMGTAIFPGLGVLLAIIPINWILSVKSSKYQRDQMEKKDERIKVISEVLSGMQVIKLYAWEPSFANQIKQIRTEELNLIKKRMYVQCCVQFIFDSIPFLVSFTAFLTYVYLNGGILDAKKTFTSVVLFAQLTDPITELPNCISAIVDASVSFKRVNRFLNAEEIDPNATIFEPRDDDDDDSKPAIEINGSSFSWDEFSSTSWNLDNINLDIESETLTAVVGSVASGKSSLLSAILGDMKYSGGVTVRGRIAYVPQIAWILNGTLRENICFGLPYAREKYNRVIEACCLKPDIEMLPAGDMTEIGEKGINLSGGQKQRVSLARAAYSGADIFLLDDVLSAVDSHVGKHIFDNLLGPNGLLSGKTRVLCTHAYNFMSQVDHVIVMESGRIVESGPYEKLIEGGGNFASLVRSHIQSKDSTEMEGCNRFLRINNNSPSDDKFENMKDPPVAGAVSPKDQGKLIEEEHLETGDVKFSIFMEFIRALTYLLAFSFVIFFAISEGMSFARNVVLSKWSSLKGDNGTNDVRSEDQLPYVIEYATFGISQSLAFLIASIILAFASLKAARLLHENMLGRILHAPMAFFNVTPLGRVVNRFSSDVESVDKNLPSNFGECITHIFKFLGIIVAIAYTNHYFLVAVMPICVVYYILQRYYTLCMQQLQRIINVLRSPIYAQFQETLSGTSTVRAYKAQDRFMATLGDKIDNFNRAMFPHLIVRRWLSIRLGGLGSIIVFIAAIFAVIWRKTADPSLVGLSISYSLNVIVALSWLVKVTSYLQYNFVSVERILEYSKVDQEAAYETPLGEEIGTDWPEEGGIIFDDYETRYRPGLDLVLKHFSCIIQPGEKIGIVGRTGAGKSSLTLALFRIVEAVQGDIVIDNVNISELGLHDLRRRLTVIPQDPVLFSRPLRLNLDPFEEYDDDRLWEALKLAHLQQFVEGLPEGLSYLISEGGENLSVGQRQLVCLARAILRKSTILILDEATASVDAVTDELIQTTIREHFAGCTILNVAHRLNTVLDSSRIMVMSHGQIAEFDTPRALLSNRRSHFYGMARDAGIVQ